MRVLIVALMFLASVYPLTVTAADAPSAADATSPSTTPIPDAPPPATPVTSTTTPVPPEERSLFEVIVDFVNKYLKALQWLFGLAFAFVTFIAIRSQSVLVKLLKGMRRPWLPQTPTTDLTRILLLGVGGVGKTSLIRKLTRDPTADPSQKTVGVTPYEFIFASVRDRLVHNHNYVVYDYRGYSPAELTGEFIKSRNSPAPSVIILVVDIVEPPADGQETRILKNLSGAQHRIDHHNAFWSVDLLQTLAVAAQCQRPRKIILFINKIDALKQIDAGVIADIKMQFLPLETQLKSAFAVPPNQRAPACVTICGSLGGDSSNKTFLDDINFAALITALTK